MSSLGFRGWIPRHRPVVPLTSTLRWAAAPGIVRPSGRINRLVAGVGRNVSNVVALDRASLTERAGKIPGSMLDLVLSGLDMPSVGSEVTDPIPDHRRVEWRPARPRRPMRR